MPQPILGKRVRHFRKIAKLTLDDVSAVVGKPSSYLSQLENGLNDPRASLVESLAEALDCTIQELNDPNPPSRRDELELAVEKAQQDPRYQDLNLPPFRPTAKTPDEALEHIASLYSTVVSLDEAAAIRPGDDERKANNDLRRLMRERNNYFADIEMEAQKVLDAVGYDGTGAISERTLIDIVAYYGFTVERVQDLPGSTRSITDQRGRTIFIPQRNSVPNRSARSIILQTLGHFVLGHRDSDDFSDYLRQRVESNYFAGAVLAPERAAVKFLNESYERKDISVEDLREVFYISYESAAHRLTNLATEHLGITLHFLRSDDEGVIWKAYQNNDVPMPTDLDGTAEGQRLCRRWGTRQAFESDSAYDLHYQWTETPTGKYWCVTYVEADRRPPHAVTVGTDADQAQYFRGSETERQSVSTCPDPMCCQQPAAQQSNRWRRVAWPSARDRSHVTSGLPAERPPFTKFPGVDMIEVYEFLDRHSD